jgi:hypothetical protein
LLGVDGEHGRIAPGKFAVIVAVPGDPVDDPSVLERVQLVMNEGVSSPTDASAMTGWEPVDALSPLAPGCAAADAPRASGSYLPDTLEAAVVRPER